MAEAKPPGGWRSNTDRETKHCKPDANLTKILDSLVGSSDGLGGPASICRACSRKPEILASIELDGIISGDLGNLPHQYLLCIGIGYPIGECAHHAPNEQPLNQPLMIIGQSPQALIAGQKSWVQAFFHIGETDSQIKHKVPKGTERKIDEPDIAIMLEHIALVGIRMH